MAGGFISVRLPERWFEWAIQCDGLHVAVAGDRRVVGFMGVTPPGDAGVEVSSLFGAMLALADVLEFDGAPISRQRFAFRGPVLIDESARGQGIYSAFNRACHEFYRDRYDVGVLFVARANQRSLHTTTRKLGATVLTEFTVDERDYYLLAFSFGSDPRDSEGPTILEGRS